MKNPVSIIETGHSRIHDLQTHIYFAPVMRIAEIANSVDPKDGAHNKLPHPDLPCLPFIY